MKWEEKAKRDFLRIPSDKKGKIKKWVDLFPPPVELEFRFNQWYAKSIAEQFVTKFPKSVWEADSPPEDVFNSILQEFGHVGTLRRKPPWQLEGPDDVQDNVGHFIGYKEFDDEEAFKWALQENMFV